jgi:hypothetical protein
LNTWALDTTHEIEIIIFLEEKSLITEESIEKIFFHLNQNLQIQACLFIVKLKYVENIYPPQKKSFYAMKFLYTFYSQRTFWFLRLDDNAYVNIEKLLPWLKSIDYQRALASKLFTANQILFFLDVDLEFTGQALDNTRRLMISSII